MGLFGGKPEVSVIKSLASEIRSRSSRGSFDGARVFGESEKILRRYPTLSVFKEDALGGKTNSKLENDYQEVLRFYGKMKQSESSSAHRRIPSE